MSNRDKFQIEEVRGVARVVDTGQGYITHVEFAVASGYPESVAHAFTAEERAKSRKLEEIKGQQVKILAKGLHGRSHGVLYIVQDSSGEKFVMGESGIEIYKIKSTHNRDEGESTGRLVFTQEETSLMKAFVDDRGGNLIRAVVDYSELYYDERVSFTGKYEGLNYINPSTFAEYSLKGESRFLDGDIGVAELGTLIEGKENIQRYYENGLLLGYYPSENFVELRKEGDDRE